MHEPTVVIWLAYSEELCEQALSEFISAWNFLGNRHLNTYRFWGKQEIDIESLKDGMIVAGLTKFHNLVKKNWESIKPLARRISLVIIDEAHQAIAPTYRNTLDLLTIPQPTGLIGLSATPGRTWNNIKSDAALSDFFGRCKVTLSIPGVDNPIDHLVEEKYLAQVNFRTLFYKSGLELTSEDLAKIKEEVEIPQYILHRLEIDEQRNLGIILEIEKLAKQHQRIIVFAISVNHCQIISTVLKLRNLQARFVTGKTSSYHREKIINWFKEHDTEPRILCNYGVLTTGFDAPKTSAIVIARPTKSLVLYSQMVGRGIRGVKAGGNSHAEIVTVVDTEIPGFRNIAETFNNWEDVWSENT